MSAIATENLTEAYKPNPFTSVIGNLFARFKNYRLYRKTIVELESLTDRDLLDFGIDRISIDKVALESVYGV